MNQVLHHLINCARDAWQKWRRTLRKHTESHELDVTANLTNCISGCTLPSYLQHLPSIIKGVTTQALAVGRYLSRALARALIISNR